MTPSETVDAFMAAFNAMDLDAAMALIADGAEYDNVPMGKNIGLDAIRALLAPMIERCSEIDWITHRQAATGNLVINERLDRFLWPHGWVEVPVAGVFEVNDGKITLWRDYFDLNTYTSQLPS